MVPTNGATQACRDGIKLAEPGQRPAFGDGDWVAYESVETEGAVARIGLTRQGAAPRELDTGFSGDQRDPAWAPAAVSMPPSL
jgi:hypothetical protein